MFFYSYRKGPNRFPNTLYLLNSIKVIPLCFFTMMLFNMSAAQDTKVEPEQVLDFFFKSVKERLWISIPETGHFSFGNGSSIISGQER